MRPSIEYEGKRYYLLDSVERFEEGVGRRFEIEGEDIAVIKIAGKVYAFGNTCPHAGGNLCDGMIRGECVSCPKHGWQFSMRTGKRVDIEEGSEVKVYGTIEAEDRYWVLLD